MIQSLCIVGCGRYARTVLNAVSDMTDEFRFFFASRDREKAERYSQDFGGAGAFGSYEEAASDPRVDALYFFTPHDLHLENVQLAARYGKHALVEKPIARTVPEASSMVDVARQAKIKLMVAENYRFLPAVEKAKKSCSRGSTAAPLANCARSRCIWRAAGNRPNGVGTQTGPAVAHSSTREYILSI